MSRCLLSVSLSERGTARWWPSSSELSPQCEAVVAVLRMGGSAAALWLCSPNPARPGVQQDAQEVGAHLRGFRRNPDLQVMAFLLDAIHED